MIKTFDLSSKIQYNCILHLLKKYNARASTACCIRAFDNKGKITFGNRITLEDAIYDSDDLIKKLLLVGGGPINILFFKEDIGNLRYIEGVINEDEPFLLELYSRIPRLIMGGHLLLREASFQSQRS